DEAVREVAFDATYDPRSTEPQEGEYASYYAVRLRVFCDEQAISIDDEVDGQDAARRHYALFRGSIALAVCRLSIDPPYVKLERVACLKEERGRGLARRLMLEVLRVVDSEFPREVLVAHSQSTVLKFYERIGFVTVSREFLDEVDILHRSIVFPPRRSRIRNLSLLTTSPSKHSEFRGDLYDKEVVETMRRMVGEIESLSFLPLCALVSSAISSVFVTASLHETLAAVALRAQRSGGYAEGYTPFVPAPTMIREVADVDFLKSVAYKMLNTGHYSEVDENWRRFYSLLYLALAMGKRDEPKVYTCLRLLDKALLMGRDVEGVLTELAERLSSGLATEPIDFRQLPLSSLDRARLTVSRPVPVLQHPLDEVQFLEEFLIPGRPVLVRCAVGHWPAIDKWTLHWFLQRHGQRRTPVEIGSKYTDEDWSQKLMTIEEFCKAAVAAERSRPLYLAQHRLLDQIPSLRKDVEIPSLCLAGSSEPQDVELNFWMGLADTLSPLHTDPRDNLFCQVLGAKFVRLISPVHSAAVGAFEEGILTNTSQLDAETLEGVECWDAEVQAGDALFIPAKWWHHVRALTPSISVSCWFDQ
ncbi:hypothetical protein PFISCL1PPCAC_22972, partial [Pristionchus fissidentatus]